MTTNVSGPGLFTSTAAAINDPFFLESDPVSAFDLITLNATDAQVAQVPEPTSLVLFCAGLAGLGFVMWRRRRVQ